MKTNEIAVGKVYHGKILKLPPGEIHIDESLPSLWPLSIDNRTVIWMGEHEGKEMVQYTTPNIVLGTHDAPTITLRAFASWALDEVR